MGKLYIISGDDDVARKRRVREVVCEITQCDEPENDPALEVISGDAEESIDNILIRFLDALRTPPFLADSKKLWLRHLPDMEIFSGDEPSKVVASVIEELTSPLPDELTVIIDAPNLDQRKSFAKKLKAAGAVIENKVTSKPGDRNFADSRRQEIFQWSQKCGKRIDADAVQYLAEVVGGSSAALANELEKLYCYTGNRPTVTLDDCKCVVSRTPEAIAWEFTAALTANNQKEAITLLGALLARQEHEIKLMAIISGEFQKTIQVRKALDDLHIRGNVNPRTFDNIPEDIRKANPDNMLLKMHPFRAFKVCEAATRFSAPELAEKISYIRDASRALVSGAGNSRIILEQLVLKLTSAPQKRRNY
ncbi:MAG: DNA polymerase III subunit delta [Lentisphaeria bacterium]|nr:DNA polymerase III subunit delta [Lentisphaeria bacterium]